MTFGQYNLGFVSKTQSNMFTFKPVQNLSSESVNNIFGIGQMQVPMMSFSTQPLSSNAFVDYWNKNQEQLQLMILETLKQILANPLINHIPTEEINNNFRPYDYNRYNVDAWVPTVNTFDFSNFNFNTTKAQDTESIAPQESVVPYSAVSSSVSTYGDNAKKISQLHPDMQEKTMQLLDYAKSKGLKVQITSGYRTQEEQQELLRTRPQFAAKKSAHCAGKAIDIKIVGGTDEDYRMLGDYAKSIGMRWGGDFSKVKERWHFDYQWG